MLHEYPRTKFDLASRVLVGRLGAETIGFAVSLGVIPILNYFAPGIMNSAYQFTSDNLVKSNINWFDRQAQGWPVLSGGAEAYAKLKDSTVEERSKYYAHQIIDNSLMFGIGLAALQYGQKAANHLMNMNISGIPEKETDKVLCKAMYVDKGVEFGSFMFLQKVTPGMTRNIEDTLVSIVKKITGYDVRLPVHFVTTFVPVELAGVLASSRGLYKFYDTHLERLAKQPESGIVYNGFNAGKA